jgi:hypothetical protein
MAKHAVQLKFGALERQAQVAILHRDKVLLRIEVKVGQIGQKTI